MLPETTTLAEILLYLGVLAEEAEEETGEAEPATLTISSVDMCCAYDGCNGDRHLTITQLLIDIHRTIDN